MNLDQQNTLSFLQLLSGKDNLYSNARNWSYVTFIVTLLPFLLQIGKLWWPQLAEFEVPLNIIGLLAGVLPEILINHRILAATRLYEKFDTDLFGLIWNKSVCGPEVLLEERLQNASKKEAILHAYKDWYQPESLSAIENNMAVLICQRQNTRWDMKQKERFSRFLGVLLVLVTTALFVWGWFRPGLSFRDWVLWGGFPLAGFLVKAWLLHRDFRVCATIQESLAGDIEAAWQEMISQKTPISSERLRHFQDQIFSYRNKNTLVPQWLHNWFKTDDQKIAAQAAEELVVEASKYFPR